MFNPSAIERLPLIALVILFSNQSLARAQIVSAPRAQAVADDALAAQAKDYIAPLEERLPLEMRFVVRVGMLSDKQAVVLDAAGRAAIKMLRQETEAALRRRQQVGGNQQVLVVHGKQVTVPATIDRELVTAPGELLRRLLCDAFKGVYPDVFERITRETERLEGRRRHAEAMAQTAAYDDVASLSETQRRELCDLLLAQSANASWRPALPLGVTNAPLHKLLVAASENRIRGFMVPPLELAKILSPPQLAAVEHAQRPQSQGYVLPNLPEGAAGIERVIRDAQAEKKKMAERRVEAQLIAIQQARQLALQKQQARARVAALEQERKRLAERAERLIDALDAVCGLSQKQRDKLSLAARMDIERWCDEHLPRPEPARQEQAVAVQLPVGNDELPSPATIFDEAASSYRKAIQGQLSLEQRELLHTTERERRAFRQRALVEAVVLGFESAAAMTAKECEALENNLHDLLTDGDRPVTLDLVHAWLRQIAEAPEGRMRTLFSDVQWPFAREYARSLPTLGEQSAEPGAAAPLPAKPAIERGRR